MRSKVSIILVVGLVATLFSLTALAQEEEQKVQLFVLWDEVVPPSKIMEYEAGLKAWQVLNTKYKFPYPVTVYKTNDNHYYSLMPIKTLADIDNLEKFWAEVKTKAGKEFEEEEAKLHKQFAGSYESGTFGVVALRLDLSYIPENPRVKTEEVNFVWWNYYYIKTGMEEEAEKIAKEWQALWKSKGITDNFNVYQAFLWPDLPAMAAAGGAFSQADYFTNLEKNIAKMGDEYLALTKKTMAACRRFEQKYGMIKKELSYVPETK
jgi:hypothetical protein